MRQQTLQSRIFQHALSQPDRKAIGFFDSDRSCDWLTYGVLAQSAGSVGASLVDLGVRPGDVVVLVVYNDRFGVDALLGALSAGAIPLLVAPPVIQGANSSLLDVLNDVVRRTSASVVIGAPVLAALRSGLEERHPNTRFVLGADEFPEAGTIVPHLPEEGEYAAFQLTSGTTGFPRICMWRQSSVIAALEGMASAMGVGPEDTYLNWTPLYHDMGLMNNLMLCLTMGIPLVMMSPFDFVKRPALWLQGLADTGATVTWSPNFGYALAAERIRDSDLDGVDLGEVRGFWNAAERIHAETIRTFQHRFASYGVTPASLKTNFGCAENVGGATFTESGVEVPVEHIDLAVLHEAQKAVAASSSAAISVVGCGKAHPGIRLHVLGQNGEDLPDGEVGELALDTVSAMDGYLGDVEATAEALDGGLLKTGDMGYLRNGEFFWTGRLKERITVRGRKVDPSDFEAALLTVPELRAGSFVAFGLDDSDLGTQKVVLVTEVPDGPADQTEHLRGSVRRAVVERLGLGIDEVVLVRRGTLAKTSSGKRRHRHFRNLYQQGELRQYEVGV